ncbi:MAG: carboxypeptidase regulatory-like domain-containing protein, partial [Bryobacteraceae bacterium]
MPRKVLLFCAVWLALSCICWGQENGSISGTVTDPSGAVVPGAIVSATEIGMKTGTTGKSNSEGQYNLLQLRPGLYVIEAEAAGFKKLSRPNVKVDVAGRITVDLHLEVGGTSETVSVTGEAPQLRTEDAQTGEVINTTMISSLPQLNRNPLELLRLSGNVQGTGLSTNGTSPISSNPAVGSTDSPGDLALAGGRTGSLDYAVDGQNINSGRGHEVLANAIPTMESVAEFKVITGGMSAEYGRSSGGIVEVVTRGGTNQLHGEGFEFFRNNLLNANSWLQNATGGQSTIYKQNIYGGDIGGPVILPKIYDGRNKTFWFFNYQGTKYRQAAVNMLGGVPTADERKGDLTGLLYNGASPLMYDPLGDYTGSGNNLTRTTLMGGNGQIVPASRIDPMTAAMMADLPSPNRPATPGFSQLDNYAGQQSTGTNAQTWNFRIDENLTDRQRIFFRFKRDDNTNTNSEWMGVLNPAMAIQMKEGLNTDLNYTFAISPTLVFTARMGVDAVPSQSGPVLSSSFNASDFPYDPAVKGWTAPGRLDFSTILGSNGGWGGSRLNNTAWPHTDAAAYNSFDPSVSLTKVLSKHVLKMGAEARRYYDNFYESGLGWMSFDGFATIPTVGGTWTQSNSNYVAANGMGDFLLGDLGYTQQSAPWTLALNTNYYAGYVQDDWKVSSKLTLNLGLRWDMETPVTERHNKLVAWDPDSPSFFTIPSTWNWNSALSAAGLSASQIGLVQEPQWASSGKYPNGAMAVAGTSQYPGNTVQPNHWNHFAPRLGAAYRLNDKTTLRASGTVMYISSTGSYYSMWSDVVPSMSGAGPSDATLPGTGIPALTWGHMFDTGDLTLYHHTVQEANYQVGGNLSDVVFSTKTDMPREYQWNFTVQRQLTSSMLAELSYAGNHSGTLLVEDNLDPFQGQYLNPSLGTLLATQIQNPVAGQIMSNSNAYTGPTLPLGALLSVNPSRGSLLVEGLNEGSSMYNALNLRVERRMSKGVAFLVNYTYSKLLDDTGGANMSFWGNGTAAKTWQPTDSFRNTYGYDPNDR